MTLFRFGKIIKHETCKYYDINQITQLRVREERQEGVEMFKNTEKTQQIEKKSVCGSRMINYLECVDQMKEITFTSYKLFKKKKDACDFFLFRFH